MGWSTQTYGNASNLLIDWMDKKPAPEVVLQLLACKCRRICELPSCVFLSSGLRCTDLCTLKDCENQPLEDSEDVIAEEDDEDDIAPVITSTTSTN